MSPCPDANEVESSLVSLTSTDLRLQDFQDVDVEEGVWCVPEALWLQRSWGISATGPVKLEAGNEREAKLKNSFKIENELVDERKDITATAAEQGLNAQIETPTGDESASG
ncbi:hypothetical protein BJ322DRAFT_1021081 [Thelephora terrestris]|uniref:Uncharacterized protein n=1 Tax=Thelephora terrestris TaxID=56493 RepID=A0A9P6HEN1_9AGAM|nr:hypothetical protein BJ322DRAFT_1021081 [Thelephora terrestris]